MISALKAQFFQKHSEATNILYNNIQLAIKTILHNFSLFILSIIQSFGTAQVIKKLVPWTQLKDNTNNKLRITGLNHFWFLEKGKSLLEQRRGLIGTPARIIFREEKRSGKKRDENSESKTDIYYNWHWMIKTAL